MRIVVDARAARSGGGETYVKNLFSYPLPAGVEVFLISASITRSDVSGRVEVIPVSARVVRPMVRSVWTRLWLSRLLSRLGADVVLVLGPRGGSRQASPWLFVTKFENMAPFHPGLRALYPPGLARARLRVLETAWLREMRAADLVIFVSEYCREVIEARAGRPLARTAVIPHGVGERFRLALRSPDRPGWLPPGDYLLYVSTFEPYKSHIELIRAFALLRQRRPTAEKLVLVGAESSREYALAVRAEIHRLDLGDAVVIAGSVPYGEMPAVYHHATAGLFTSICESCPNVLLEAMASGLPLIVSNRPPMPEFAGGSVLYVDPTRPDDLADRMVQLLEDHDLRARLGQEAERRARRFEWRDTAAQTWDAILQLAEDRP